jgi:hypothetical protein
MSEDKTLAEAPGQDGTSEPIVLPIAWSDPGPAVFANQALVTMDEDAVHLGFYQAMAPFDVLLSKEAHAQAIKEHRPVRAQCVAHIAWPAGRIDSLVRVLTELVSKRREMEAKEKG